MTHPFLFHPQVAPWFKESADTLLLTLFIIPAMYTYMSGKRRGSAPWSHINEQKQD